MDRIASVLLEFPPVGAQLEGAQYNQAAVQHAKNVEKLLSSQELHNYAHQLIDVCATALFPFPLRTSSG
jgi:hypothetical protein